jgi:hypothetical protein
VKLKLKVTAAMATKRTMQVSPAARQAAQQMPVLATKLSAFPARTTMRGFQQVAKLMMEDSGWCPMIWNFPSQCGLSLQALQSKMFPTWKCHSQLRMNWKIKAEKLESSQCSRSRTTGRADFSTVTLFLTTMKPVLQVSTITKPRHTLTIQQGIPVFSLVPKRLGLHI